MDASLAELAALYVRNPAAVDSALAPVDTVPPDLADDTALARDLIARSGIVRLAVGRTLNALTAVRG